MFFLTSIVAAPLFSQPAATEKFLVPIWLPQPASGAYGSSWVSELRVMYSGHTSTIIDNLGINATDDTGFFSIMLVPEYVVANPHLVVDGFSGATPGAILDVPASAARDLEFQLRVRDTSREAAGWGTWIPVVPESQFVRGPIHLFDVPTRHTYRWMLRVYSMEGHGRVRVRVHPVYTGPQPGFGSADPQIATVSVPLIAKVESAAGYAQVTLDDLGDYTSEIARHHGFRLTVEPEADFAIWAMVSVTNNVTQEVTMILPQP